MNTSHTRIFGVLNSCFGLKQKAKCISRHLFHTKWRELTPLLLLKAWWNRWIVSNRAQNQYGSSNDILTLRGSWYYTLFRTSHWNSIIWILCFDFFSSVVALRCRISVAVCGINFRRMRSSAHVTDNGCGPDISLFICTKFNSVWKNREEKPHTFAHECKYYINKSSAVSISPNIIISAKGSFEGVFHPWPIKHIFHGTD